MLILFVGMLLEPILDTLKHICQQSQLIVAICNLQKPRAEHHMVVNELVCQKSNYFWFVWLIFQVLMHNPSYR